MSGIVYKAKVTNIEEVKKYLENMVQELNFGSCDITKSNEEEYTFDFTFFGNEEGEKVASQVLTLPFHQFVNTAFTELSMHNFVSEFELVTVK